MITFCFDRLINDSIGYPNLARWPAEPYTAEWRSFDQHWPGTVPLRLLMYFEHNNIPFNVSTVSDAELGFYPVAFGWFDFDCDYVALMPELVRTKCATNCEFKILFYYHEGDNPVRIQQRLDQLCQLHNLPVDCYRFVSANTAANYLDRCLYFGDHEFFFRHLNRTQHNIDSLSDRTYDFTLLSRTHKWWRASCVADLVNENWLANSLWSYNTEIAIDDRPEDNPLELDSVPEWRSTVDRFVANGPYTCDSLDDAQQNDHHWVNTDLYQQSNIHIILETHFDADQSNGAFITEKTYKAIKYGQPFIIVGAAGTLDQLRKDGYRVFDHVIDNQYDAINDNTLRWLAIKKTVSAVVATGTDQVFRQCQHDVLHNQRIFDQRQQAPLNTLQGNLLSCLKK